MTPLLTPQGHLLLAPDADEQPLPAELQRRLADSFALGAGHGLLQLGGRAPRSKARVAFQSAAGRSPTATKAGAAKAKPDTSKPRPTRAATAKRAVAAKSPTRAGAKPGESTPGKVAKGKAK